MSTWCRVSECCRGTRQGSASEGPVMDFDCQSLCECQLLCRHVCAEASHSQFQNRPGESAIQRWQTSSKTCITLQRVESTDGAAVGYQERWSSAPRPSIRWCRTCYEEETTKLPRLQTREKIVESSEVQMVHDTQFYECWETTAIDDDSGMSKAGHAGNDAHHANLPSIPDRPWMRDIMDGMDQDTQILEKMVQTMLQEHVQNAQRNKRWTS